MSGQGNIGIFYIKENSSISNIVATISKVAPVVDLAGAGYSATEQNKINKQNTKVIVALGGDGTVLQGVQKYSHLGIPFYGINYGNIGFLTNKARGIDEIVSAITDVHNLRSISVPMFECKIEQWIKNDHGGEINKEIAVSGNKQNGTTLRFINDTNAFRASGQAVQLSISISGKNQSELVYCDGVVVFSPLGSTGYNKSLGGEPIPLESTSFGLRVIAPSSRASFFTDTLQHVIKEGETVTIVNKNPEYRPCHCGVDGQTVHNIKQIEIRKLPRETVTLLFDLEGTPSRQQGQD